MPKHAPELDALAFAERLKEAMADCGIDTGHGIGAWLSRNFKVSKYTGNAWAIGSHKPKPNVVQEMAARFRVQFEWLYTGNGPKRLDLALAEARASYDSVDITTYTPQELELVRLFRIADESDRKAAETVLKASVLTKGRR
jgi:hypothetical protein